MNSQEEIFFKTCYLPETQLFLQRVQEVLNNGFDELLEQFNSELERYIEALINEQADFMPIGMISISFLHTSLYFNKPVFRLDAYDESGLLGESQYSSSIDATWLFTYWQDYETALRNAIDTHHWQRTIKPERVTELMRQSVQSLLYEVMIFFKYWATTWDELEALKRMRKAEHFCISFGEYQDWQRTLYVEQPEIDLFNMAPETLTTFRKFQDKTYRNKVFKKMDLQHCQFINCTFRQCEFQEVLCDDAIFIDCNFYDAKWEQVSFKGASFIGCDFISVTGEQIVTGISGCKPKEIKDLYKFAEFDNCLYEAVCFKNSQLTQAKLNECIVKQLSVKTSDVSTSDFAAYLEE